MRTTAVLVAPLSVLVGLDRPPVLLGLLLFAVVVAALARTGLWLLGELAEDPDRHAARAGLGAFAAGVVFAAGALVLGPLVALLVVPATVLVALWFRPGRRAEWLVTPLGPRSPDLAVPFVERPADER